MLSGTIAGTKLTPGTIRIGTNGARNATGTEATTGTVITIGMIADQEFLPGSGRTAIWQIPLPGAQWDRSSQALSFQRSAAKRSLVLQHRSFHAKIRLSFSRNQHTG